jgi:hypothetical protein
VAALLPHRAQQLLTAAALAAAVALPLHHAPQLLPAPAQAAAALLLHRVQQMLNAPALAAVAALAPQQHDEAQVESAPQRVHQAAEGLQLHLAPVEQPSRVAA